MEIEGLTVLQNLYRREDNCRCDFRVGRTFEGQGIVLSEEQKQGSHFELKWSEGEIYGYFYSLKRGILRR